MSSQSYVTIGFSMFQFCFVKLGSVAIVQHHNSITSPHVVLYHTAILTSIHVSKAPESRTAAVAFQQPRACRPAWGSQAPGCCINRHYPSRTGYVTGYVTGYSTVPRCSAECISKTDSPKTTICKICDPRDDSRWPKVFFFKDDVTKDTFTGMTTIMIHWWSSPKACDVCRVFWWEYHSGNQWLKWLNGFKYAASTWNGWKTQKYT